MLVYRIVKSEERAADLSGKGAYLVGGRWNSPGVYALYTSEHESLCLLELMVHLDEEDLPEDLYLMEIEIQPSAKLLELTEDEMPHNWRLPENIQLKEMGDALLVEKNLGFIAPSAVMPTGKNIILNPRHPKFSEFVKVKNIIHLETDARLRKN